MITCIHRILAALTMVFAVLAPVTSARAQDAAGTPDPNVVTFTLNPVGQADGTFFEFDAEPGSTTRLSVEFANTWSDELALRSYVADGYTLPNGGLGVGQESQATTAPTPWIAYPADTYDLAPNDGRQVDFTVTVPDDAAPGNYVSVLVLQTVDPVPVAGTDLLDQIIQKAVAIDITVPGDAEAAFTLGTPDYDESGNVPVLTIPLDNSGALRVRPAGTLTVTDPGGNAVISADVALGSVFARTSTVIQLALQQPLASGDYTIDLDLTDADTSSTASLDAVPLTVTSATPVAQSLVSFTDIVVTPLPDASAPQFAGITGTVANGGSPITSAKITLVAMQDGKEVERFPLVPSISLPSGETDFEQRYIPISGFTTGTWTFQLILESVDTSSNASTVIVTQDIEGSIVVP